jgi:hypothetical protein
MTVHALRRLLAELPNSEPPHPIDAGLLGEYAYARREHGQSLVGERYPRVDAHVRAGCQRCQDGLDALRALARGADPGDGPVPGDRLGPGDSVARESLSDVAAIPERAPSLETVIPEPIEIAEAIALGRAIEAERDALRAPLRPDGSGQVDTRRQSTRRRTLLLVESALVRQRLVARRLFLDRASAMLAPNPPAARAPLLARGPGAGGRFPNPKARLLLDEFAGGVDDLARGASRVGRLTADLRRLGDDPRGPARSQSEALTNRGLGMTREALAVDHRLARLQGILAGMVA